MEVCGGYWWLWVMEKELGMLEVVLEERRIRNDVFPKLHEKQRLKHSSVYARGKGSVTHTPDVVSKIATVRSWTSVL